MGISQSRAGAFRPGERWLDTASHPIQAHGGGILVHGNVYYWFGEDRSTRRTAVSCYASTNLYDWTRLGVAFDPADLPEDLRETSFIERPKAVFNPRTRQFVMWFHLEQEGYHFARAGVAVAEQVAGPYRFVHALRPIGTDYGYKADDPDRQKELGGTFRDMNLFVDGDGKAYVFYASEGNWTMYVVRLNTEFTGPESPAVEGKTWSRILVRQMREAPAPFIFRGRYHLVTSGCTGWNPNAADHATANNILGPYEQKGNPCVGPDAELTFRSQSTFMLPAPGRTDAFIFMADRWMPRRLDDSRYVWLPARLKPDGSLVIEWRDSWDLSIFEKN